jgi:hypothetical protein
MRTRPSTLVALTASLSLLLGACSSGTDTAPGPTEPADAQADVTAPEPQEESVGSTAQPVRGYLCRYVDQQAQEAVAGGALQDPYQVIVANDRDSWVCETRDGDQALVRVSILRGEGVWSAQRDLAQDQEGVTDGAEYLGESYRSARRITGLTMCAGMVDGEATHEPYALVVEALPESDEDVSGDFSKTVSALARSMDQTVGCSPRMARGEISGPTPSS